MQNHKHELTLTGGTPAELRVSASVLQHTLSALIEGARLATRFAIEGQSSRKGPRPAWLDAACAFEITALRAGSAVIQLEAPNLHEAAAERCDPAAHEPQGQASLFATQDADLSDRSAIDLFADVLAATLDPAAEDIAADRPLLDACIRFARAAEPQFTGITLSGLRGRSAPLRIDPAHIPQIQALRDARDSDGVSTFFGTCPGEESDEELLAALRDIE